MRKPVSLLLFFILAVSLTACKKENVSLKQVLPQIPFKPSQVTDQNKKKIPVRYEYPGFRYREPFIPLTGGGFSMRSADEIVVPSIDSLTLRGIMGDKKARMALLSGGGISYILDGGKLYDNRRRLVPGISGVIKKDSVLMIDAANKTNELKFTQTK